MGTILSDGPVSYYQQLYTILRDELTRGKWKPGERMPSETELIAAYGVSRITVRQAFDLLVNDGFVYRRRGSGTFVTARSSAPSLNRILSFTEDMEQRGLRPETRPIAARLEPAAADVARKLGIEPGEELVVLESLCLADDAPMSVEHSHLVHRHCPGLLEGDYARASLHRTLLEGYGIRLARADQAVRAVAADAETAAVLSVLPGAPLLCIEQVLFRQTGVPVEYLQAYRRGDRYVLYNELRA